MAIIQQPDVIGGIIVKIPSVEVVIDNATLIVNSSSQIALNPTQPNPITFNQPPYIIVNSNTGTFTGALEITNCSAGVGYPITFYGKAGTSGTYGTIEYGSVDSGATNNVLLLSPNWNDTTSGHTNQIILQPMANTGPAGLYAQFTNGTSTSVYLYTENSSGETDTVLNDGFGNMSANKFTGTFSSDATAASTITVGTSPYTYKNTASSNQEVFINGGTITAISFLPNGGTGISLNTTISAVILRPNDEITITYTTAPNITTIQL